jgi:hypothetical protein
MNFNKKGDYCILLTNLLNLKRDTLFCEEKEHRFVTRFPMFDISFY